MYNNVVTNTTSNRFQTIPEWCDSVTGMHDNNNMPIFISISLGRVVKKTNHTRPDIVTDGVADERHTKVLINSVPVIEYPTVSSNNKSKLKELIASYTLDMHDGSFKEFGNIIHASNRVAPFRNGLEPVISSSKPDPIDSIANSMVRSSPINQHNIKRDWSTAFNQSCYSCDKCLYWCSTREELKKHVQKHAMMAKAEAQKIHYQCPMCPRVYQRENFYKSHLARHNQATVNPHEFECAICFRTYASIASLKAHRLLHEKYSSQR